MLSLFEKNSQLSQETSHLMQAKSEQLFREFQFFLEQEQQTPMAKLAEVKVAAIDMQYKNIHSMLRMRNQRKQESLNMKHEQVRNARIATVETICQKTTDGFKFIKVEAVEDMKESRSTTRNNSLAKSSTFLKQQELQDRFAELKQKLKNVEEAIFAENMVHDGLKATLEIEKHANSSLRSKVDSFHHKNETLKMKNSWYVYVRNMAGCQRISSKAFVDKTQKLMAASSRKDCQRIDKWAEKSRSLHRQQQQIKLEYLKEACRLEELHILNNEKVAEVKKLVVRQPMPSGKRDTLTQIISDIGLIIQSIHQNEENFEEMVLETCGKPRGKLRVAQSMDNVRVSQIELINCFEAKYNFKVESAYKIILYVYGRLRQNQKKVVMEFDELTTMKQERELQLKVLEDKLGNTVGQLTSSENDRQPTVDDICKLENDCQSVMEQANARNRFLLDVTQYLIGMVSRMRAYFQRLESYSEAGSFRELGEKLARLMARYDPIDKKDSLQRYMVKERLVWDFVKENFPLRESVLKECCSMLTGDSRFMYSIKSTDLKLCLTLVEEESGTDISEMLQLENNAFNGIFVFLARALSKSHNTHLQYIWEMLKAVASCQKELKSKELPRIKKLPKLNPAVTTVNPNKFYSVFVSNDLPEPLDEKISNKFIINEPEVTTNKENKPVNPQQAIHKFLKVAAQPISCFQQHVLAVGGKESKRAKRTHVVRTLKSAGGY